MTDLGLLNKPSAVRTLELGDVRLTYVVDGALWLTTADFFPAVPADYWADHPEAVDAEGRIVMCAGGLLVERDGRRLLIDVGMGEYRGRIPVGSDDVGEGDTGSLPETLAALGVRPADIEVVAFTHLHGDHTGWALAGDQKFFPDARYLVAAPEWAPHDRGEVIPGAPPRESVIEPLAPLRTEIADGEEIFPGVHALVTPGHTPGHTSYVISTPAGRVVAFGDAFHVPAQLVHPEWPSRPDVDAEGVQAARRRLVAELSAPDTIGFGIHFGDQVFGRLVAGEWQPVPARAVLPYPRG